MPYKDPQRYLQWKKDNPERVKENNKKYYRDNIALYKVHNAYKRAKEKNIFCDITEQDVKDIWPEDNKCPALGMLLVVGDKHSKKNTPSLDRIDCNKGYTKDNIQIVSHLANLIMTNATPDQVIQVGQYFKKVTEDLNNV